MFAYATRLVEILQSDRFNFYYVKKVSTNTKRNHHMDVDPMKMMIPLSRDKIYRMPACLHIFQFHFELNVYLDY